MYYIDLDFACDLNQSVCEQVQAHAAKFGCLWKVIDIVGPSSWPLVRFTADYIERIENLLEDYDQDWRDVYTIKTC